MLTPQAELRIYIVKALGELGGSAPRSVVLNAIEERMGSRLSDEDMEPVASRKFEEKWRNRASYERAEMVRVGLLVDRRDGVWELDEEGRALLMSLR